MIYKKYVICIAASLAVLLGVSYVIGQRGADKAESSSAAKRSESAAMKEPDTQPIDVENDTEGDRNYGGDILYKHDGLTVRLIESDLESSSIRLLFQNETDSTMVFSTDSVVVNGMVTSCSTLAIVEPGAEEERVLLRLTDDLPSGSKADEVKLKFLIYDEEDFTQLAYSETITITYSEAEHDYTLPDSAKLIWEKNGFEVYECGAKMYASEDGESYVSVGLCIENHSDKEYVIHNMYGAQCEINGEPIPLDCWFYNKMPPGTVMSDSMVFNAEEGQSLDGAEEITFSLQLYDAADESFETFESGEITLGVTDER